MAPEPRADETAQDAPQGFRLEPITAERTIPAAPAILWELCSTRGGLESWWSPEGLVFTVETLQARSGGRVEFRYEEAASARDPTWRAELEAKGQGTSFRARGTFLEFEPPRRIGFQQQLDFGPRRARQEFRFSVELHAGGSRTRVIATAEAPPSKHWALLGRTNFVGQLERLERATSHGPT